MSAHFSRSAAEKDLKKGNRINAMKGRSKTMKHLMQCMKQILKYLSISSDVSDLWDVTQWKMSCDANTVDLAPENLRNAVGKSVHKLVHRSLIPISRLCFPFAVFAFSTQELAIFIIDIFRPSICTKSERSFSSLV
jgi:hypothetical protein